MLAVSEGQAGNGTAPSEVAGDFQAPTCDLTAVVIIGVVNVKLSL
jgi:hypothetical protein